MEKRKRAKEIDFKYNLSLYWTFLRKYKLFFLAILVVILFMEALRLVSQFLLRVIIDRGAEFSAGIITAEAFIAVLMVVAIIYVSKVVLLSVLVFVRIHGINVLDSKLMADIKRKFFDHIIHLDHNFHMTNKTGSLISRLVRSGGAVERLTDVFLFNFAPLLLQLVVVTFSLMYFSWVPALIIFVTMVFFIGYSFYMQRISESANIEAINAEDIEKFLK